MKYLTIFLFVYTSFSFAIDESISEPRKCEGVSLVVLIGDSPAHDGKCVTTTGIINIGPEWSYLFLNSESNKHLILLNGLGLGFDQHQSKVLAQYQGRYISITGYYDNKSNSLSDEKFFTFK